MLLDPLTIPAGMRVGRTEGSDGGLVVVGHEVDGFHVDVGHELAGLAFGGGARTPGSLVSAIGTVLPLPIPRADGAKGSKLVGLFTFVLGKKLNDLTERAGRSRC